MGKVFITKYPMSVNNNDLEILGCLRVKFKKSAKNAQGFRNIVVQYADGQIGTAKVTSGNAHFTDGTMSNDLGKSINLISNDFNSITLSNDECNIDISNKYNIVNIQHWHGTEDQRIKADVYIDLTSLKVLTNLTTLILSNTLVSGSLSDIANFTNLTILALSNTLVSGSFSDIANLTNLTTLNLGSTSLSGSLSDIANLTNLTSLILSSTSLSGSLSDIANLTNLTSLSLRVTPVTGVIGSLKNLTKLTELVLDSTSVTGDVTDIIDSLIKLKRLAIPSTIKITDAQKQTLTSRGCTVEVY